MTDPERYLAEGERVVVSTRTHPKVLLWPVLAVLATLVLAVVVAGLDVGSLVHTAGWLLVLVALLWFAAVPLVRWWSTTYTFTDQRFMKRSGLLTRTGRTIPLDRISGVDVEVGLTDRLWGCGTLVVTDASQDGRVLVDDVPHVERVQVAVVEELSGRRRSGDDGS